MCADLLSDAVFGDLRSVPFVFTRPVFEVRQAKQDGGDNIYMAYYLIFANVFSLFLRMYHVQIKAYYKDVLKELCLSSINAEKMDVRGATLKQL